METTELIDTLDTEGNILLSVARKAGWDRDVPTCPGWRMRDLVGHQGNVHRWAADYVREALAEPRSVPEHHCGDSELAQWFEEGLRELVTALRTATDDLRCWVFLPGASSPRAFWARRQVHETTVHRMDAELAANVPLSPVAADVAMDGIDEILTGWHGRSRSLVRAANRCVLSVRAVEGQEWTLHLGTDAPRVLRQAAEAWDCRLSGPAQELYAALWNRHPYSGDGLTVEGDEKVMALWRNNSPIL